MDDLSSDCLAKPEEHLIKLAPNFCSDPTMVFVSPCCGAFSDDMAVPQLIGTGPMTEVTAMERRCIGSFKIHFSASIIIAMVPAVQWLIFCRAGAAAASTSGPAAPCELIASDQSRLEGAAIKVPQYVIRGVDPVLGGPGCICVDGTDARRLWFVDAAGLHDDRSGRP